MKLIFSALISFLFFSIGEISAQQAMVRYPALNSDGSQIAFSYQGDIWTVASNGGEARRLTVHQAYESEPQWSPDDKKIAFSSNRFGGSDIFVMSKAGSDFERLTFHSAGDSQAKWTKDKGLVFSTRRDFAEVERASEIYMLSPSKSTPGRFMDALGTEPNPSPDGRYIAYVDGYCRTSREAYVGPANQDIWIYDTQSQKYHQITTFEGQDFNPDWGKSGELFFLSARNGRYNIYKINIENGKPNGEPQAITNYKDEGIMTFDISSDGKKAVFTRKESVYTLDIQTKAKPKTVDIKITSDSHFDQVITKNFSSEASEIALSPNGKYLGIVIHGEVFLKKNDKEKSRAVQLTRSAARERSIEWLNDSTLLFLSDRNGNYDLFSVSSSDPDQADLYKTLKREVKELLASPEDEFSLSIAPNKEQIAFQRGRGKLIVANIDSTGTVSKLNTLLDGWSTPGGVCWSPDSKWLAYSLDDLNFNEEIYIHKADNKQAPVAISLHPRSDSRPVWSQEGSKLGFLSTRNNGDSDVWFVWLNKKDWEKTKRDWEDDDEGEDDKKNGKKKKNGKDSTAMDIRIDFEDIHERLAHLFSPMGHPSNIF